MLSIYTLYLVNSLLLVAPFKHVLRVHSLTRGNSENAPWF
jgi:hypothetical protein